MTDAAVHTGANAKAERRSELDAMGVLIVVGLILFHSTQIFYGGDFFVQNEPWSMVALVAMAGGTPGFASQVGGWHTWSRMGLPATRCPPAMLKPWRDG